MFQMYYFEHDGKKSTLTQKIRPPLSLSSHLRMSEKKTFFLIGGEGWGLVVLCTSVVQEKTSSAPTLCFRCHICCKTATIATNLEVHFKF